jgi:hypothetical protein
VDNRLSSIFCCFPSFPLGRPRESVQELAPEYSSARNLPAYTGSPPDSEKNFEVNTDLAVPRYLPADLVVNFVTLEPPGFEQPPYYPGATKEKSREPSSKSLKPQPLRLVRESRKKKSPAFYSENSRSLLQSTTYITIEPTTASSTAISSLLVNMSTNPPVQKAPPTLPSGPRPAGMAASPSKDDILADLRRQVSEPPIPPFPFHYVLYLLSFLLLVLDT